MSSLPLSPVTHAFAGIQFDTMQKLRLTDSEIQLLRTAEANPIDYTLNNSKESTAYVKAVLKVLAEASGASGPSSKVSHLKGLLPEDEALQLLYTDPMGVVTHYAITKLYDIVVCLKEKKNGSAVSIGSTFYNAEDGSLIDEWRPLLRVLHLGGSGDAFAQREFNFFFPLLLLRVETTLMELLTRLPSYNLRNTIQVVLHTASPTSSWQAVLLNVLQLINRINSIIPL